MTSRQAYGPRTEAGASLNRIRARTLDGRVVSVTLSGEFDVGDWDALRRTLAGVSGAGRPIRVDLSGVTFLDVLCARALVSGFGGHGGVPLLLSDPSWQARSSLRACSSGEAARSRGVDRAEGRSDPGCL